MGKENHFHSSNHLNDEKCETFSSGRWAIAFFNYGPGHLNILNYDCLGLEQRRYAKLHLGKVP